jgi:hypothetical protein
MGSAQSVGQPDSFYSLFPVPYSLFPVPCSLFPVPCNCVPHHIRAQIPPLSGCNRMNPQALAIFFLRCESASTGFESHLTDLPRGWRGRGVGRKSDVRASDYKSRSFPLALLHELPYSPVEAEGETIDGTNRTAAGNS